MLLFMCKVQSLLYLSTTAVENNYNAKSSLLKIIGIPCLSVQDNVQMVVVVSVFVAFHSKDFATREWNIVSEV
jgi:hypothetical protein